MISVFNSASADVISYEKLRYDKKKKRIRYNKISIINIVVVVGAVEKSVCPFFCGKQPKARPQTAVVKLWEMFVIFKAVVFYVETVDNCGVEVYKKWKILWIWRVLL